MNTSKQLRKDQSSEQLFFNPNAFYYLMKNGFILRMEKELDLSNLPLLIKANLIDKDEVQILNQEQANYRVAIFRDEILEWDEYQERVFGFRSH